MRYNVVLCLNFTELRTEGLFLISTCYVQLHIIVILFESNLNIPQLSLSLNY